MQGSLFKMFSLAVNIGFVLTLAGGVLPGCVQIKETGRTIGRTTRDVTKVIGHGARDITRAIGHGTRDVVREVGAGARDATHTAAEKVKKVETPGSGY